MIVNQNPNTAFNPVTITLETQDEVNKLSALFRLQHFDSVLNHMAWWEMLDRYAEEPATSNLVQALAKELR